MTSRRSSRRSFLRTACGGALAGVVGGASSAGSAVAESGESDARSDAWYGYRHDAANTGRNPAATGPADAPNGVWTARASDGVAVDDGRIHTGDRALSAAGEELWALPGGATYSTPVLGRFDGRVYTVRVSRRRTDGGGDRIDVLGVDPATGEIERTVPVIDADGDASLDADAAPKLDGRVLYLVATRTRRSVPGSDRLLYAVDLSQCTVRWCDRIDRCPSEGAGDGTGAHLGVRRNRLVVSLTDGVRGYDARRGEHLWTALASDRRDVAPGPAAIGRRRAFVGTRNGAFYALSLRDGSVRWRSERSEAWSVPAVDDDAETVYVGSSDGTDDPAIEGQGERIAAQLGKLYAFDATDGSVRSRTTFPVEFRAPAPDEVRPEPLVDASGSWRAVTLTDDRLFVGTNYLGFYLQDALFAESSHLAAFDLAADGSVGGRAWDREVGRGPGEPVVVGETIYLATDDGDLTAYR